MALQRIHTDLAIGGKEGKKFEDNGQIRGVVIEEDYNQEKDIRTTVVRIETENGAKTMGRPQGVYITIEAPNLSVPDEVPQGRFLKLCALCKKSFAEKRRYSSAGGRLGKQRNYAGCAGTGGSGKSSYYQTYY